MLAVIRNFSREKPFGSLNNAFMKRPPSPEKCKTKGGAEPLHTGSWRKEREFPCVPALDNLNTDETFGANTRRIFAEKTERASKEETRENINKTQLTTHPPQIKKQTREMSMVNDDMRLSQCKYRKQITLIFIPLGASGEGLADPRPVIPLSQILGSYFFESCTSHLARDTKKKSYPTTTSTTDLRKWQAHSKLRIIFTLANVLHNSRPPAQGTRLALKITGIAHVADCATLYVSLSRPWQRAPISHF